MTLNPGLPAPETFNSYAILGHLFHC